ncbi:MAG TPA: tannase/feruloyl esterase family alpha/beta hydrolase [Rhizomicrobium sp.]|nr:tannase/feruloyl esterase family alpha/beta hydrolase [Rhizomicrobium sp.]
MGHLRTLASVVALLPALAASSHAAKPASGHGDVQSCMALAGRTIAPNTKIQSAGYLADGGTIGATKVALPLCRVVGVATPTSDSHIGFEVWLPPAAQWNGKFQGEGSGGSAGSISTGAMLEALKAGYATMSTDNGHITDTTQKNGGSEQTWALGHPEKMLDFAFRAMHLSTIAGKAVTHAFYGRSAGQSYFVGCSQGGHHALMEASRYPADYDGIVAGAPAWHWASQMVNATWNSQAPLKDPSAITAESVAILHKAVIAACDKLDGLEDGMISDARRCRFEPATLLCKPGSASGTCLSQAQIDAANRIYQGAHKSDGTALFQGFARGSELKWPNMWASKTPGGSSWDFWRYSVFQDPNFRNVDFDFDRDADRGLSTVRAGMRVSDIYSVKPDLSAFRARGGKLIIYHGWADEQVTPFASLDFYSHMLAHQDQAGTDAFLRMFMMPGISHCSGGPGAGNIGGSTPALSRDPEHDVVSALDAWVVKHQAPAQLIAAHLDDNKKVDRTRPLCPFPQEARYKGTGDGNDAGNFICAVPPDYHAIAN